MTKITTATPMQWAAVDELREQWIANQTIQHADEDIINVVHRMYGTMGDESPIVLIAPSPLSMVVWSAIAVDLLKRVDCGKLYSQLDSQLRSKLYSQLYSQLDSQLRSKLDSQLGSQLESQLGSQLYSQLRSQLRSKLDSQLGSQLRLQLDSQLYSQLGSQLGSQPWYIGLWWRAWSGWYQGAQVLGVKFDDTLLNLFVDWNEMASCWCAYKGLCVVSRNPTDVHWADRELNNASGPAVLYADGWSHFAINGVAVDEQIVMRPESQTIMQIAKEENEEVKRIRIERYGWGRYIKDVKAKVVDQRRNDIDGTYEALFVMAGGMKAFCGRCRSTGRVYFLEVDPDIKTCEQSQKWMMGNRQGNIIGAS